MARLLEFFLQIAQGQIERQADTGDGGLGLGGVAVAQGRADQQREFGLEVAFAAVHRDGNLARKGPQRGGRLDEQHRLRRGLAAHFGDMGGVVEPDADHLSIR